MTQKHRSQHGYGKRDKDGFVHCLRMNNQGFPDHAFDGRPIIGNCAYAGGVPAVLGELKNHLRFADTVMGGDIMGRTLFLASNTRKIMTGQVLVIDGGVVVTG